MLIRPAWPKSSAWLFATLITSKPASFKYFVYRVGIRNASQLVGTAVFTVRMLVESDVAMNYTLLGKIWRWMPGRARWRLIRMSQPTFTASAGAVVLNRDGEVLLLHHVLRPGSGWGIPGGFLDRAEQPEAAIRREMLEETGIELHEVRLLKAHTVVRHIEFLYAARTDGAPRVLSREITELGWFAPGELPKGLPHAHAKIIEAVWRGEI